MSRRVSIFGSSFVTPPLWEPETVAYMTAVGIPADGAASIYGITNNAVWLAVDAAFVGLKNADIYGPTWAGWDSSKVNLPVFYPMIGGTAATHKFNAANPLDTNAAFRLQFFGGWTHGSTGGLPSTNGYADTFFNPALNLSLIQVNNASMGVYVRTNSTTGIMDMSNYRNIAAAGGLAIMAKYRTDNDAYYRAMNTSGDIIVTPMTDARGLSLINTRASNTRRFVKNNVLRNTNTNATQASMLSQTIILAAGTTSGMPSIAYYSNREIATAFIASGLTDAQETAMWNVINNLNTALNRNV